MIFAESENGGIGPLRVCGICSEGYAGAACPRCAFSGALNAAGSSTAGDLGPSSWTHSFWLPPQLQFQQYRLAEDKDGAPLQLGRGGMGVTYQAFDTQLEIPVVLKFVNPALFGGRSIEQRFLREARVAARLRHQNIATILNLGQQDGRWFYAMEFVPGRTLEQFVHAEGPLDPELVREIGRQTTLALAEAGRLQLVHRDIKPSNLMVERVPTLPGSGAEPTDLASSIRVKIIDFGLVKKLDALEDAALTDTGMLGTPHYASPEQLREGPIDCRADFYALGATLYFALTGKTLTAGSRAEVMAHHLKPPGGHVLAEEGKVAMFKDGWGEILLRLLSFSPEDRPADAGSVMRLLESRAALPPALGRAEKPRRSRYLIWAACILLPAASIPLALSWLPGPSVETQPPRIKYPGLTESDLAERSVEKLMARGWTFFNSRTRGDLDIAAQFFERVIELDPNHAQAHGLLSRTFVGRYLRGGFGKYLVDQAKELALRARELDRREPQAYFAMAQVNYAHGRYRLARNWMSRARILAPRDGTILRALASYSRELGELEHALIHARAATELAENDSFCWNIRANIEKKLELDAEALSSYERSARLSSTNPEPLLGIAHLHLLRKDLPAARAALKRCADLSGDDADTLCMRAQIDLSEGNFDDAIKALQLAVEAKPAGNPLYFGQVRYKSLLGFLLQRNGKITEGTALLNEALQLDERDLAGGSESQYLRFSRAASLFGLGREEEGKATFLDAIEHGWRDYRTTASDVRFERARGWIADVMEQTRAKQFSTADTTNP